MNAFTPPQTWQLPMSNAQYTPSQLGDTSGNDMSSGARKRRLVGQANSNTDQDAPNPIGSGGNANGSTHTSTSRTFQPLDKPGYFKSRWIESRTEIEQTWLYEKRDPREKLQTILPMCGFLIGLCIAGFLIWEGYHSVSRNLYCPVMVDDFSSGRLNETMWSTEIEVGGHGVGSFEQTTNDPENIYIGNDETLYLRPTLQNPSLITNNTVVDLRGHGCTGRHWTDCVAATNTTNGTILNPVRSARINTKMGANIRYGRVEVTAKLPQGDWLWPSIFMLPKNNTYGEWPKSGEIDIVQSRGNDITYKQGGNNVIASCLHFGPNKELDGWWRNNVKSTAYRETFSDRFHKFGVEWTDKYIFTYIDTRLLQVAYTHFHKPFWNYGEFPTADRNGTRLINPWEYGSHATPFDQEFYLVLRVGVGSTNGWFEDNKSGKPWLDGDHNAAQRFWEARGTWYPTWKKQGWMEVSSVKMWQLAPHQGCTPEKAQRFVG